jgi:hypothetical protein
VPPFGEHRRALPVSVSVKRIRARMNSASERKPFANLPGPSALAR